MYTYFVKFIVRWRGCEEWQNSLQIKNMWLKVEGFKDLLKTWWMGHGFIAFFGYISTSKLKALKMDLKAQNKEVFKNVLVQKVEALNCIDFQVAL